MNKVLAHINKHPKGAIIATNRLGKNTLRYFLWRTFKLPGQQELFPENFKTACFIMLNPSTADAHKDDPTIRRCRNFAMSWGCCRLFVVNLHPYRTSSPKDLWSMLDFYDANPCQVIGMTDLSHNNEWVEFAIRHSDIAVAAWGGGVPARHWNIIGYLQDAIQDGDKPVKCLGKTKRGEPRHPLYAPKKTALENYWPWE